MKPRLFGLVAALLITFLVAAPTSAATMTSYSTFLHHVITIANREADILDDASYDLGNYDARAASADYARLLTLATSERAWIKKHTPQSCYRSLYSAWTNATNNYYYAALYSKRWLRAYPYGTNADYNRSMSYMNSAATWTDRATSRMNSTHC